MQTASFIITIFLKVRFFIHAKLKLNLKLQLKVARVNKPTLCDTLQTLCDTLQKSTQPLEDQHHQAVVYPWVLELVLDDQMPFLASTSRRLEKRCWNLETYLAVGEF